MNKDKLIEICSYILQGLSEDEACILSDVDPVKLREAKRTSPDVVRMLEKNSVKFKLSHLKEIQSKKSGGNSQWILEKLRPEEFGTKAKNQQPINIISQIIQNIQNGEEQSKLSPTTRGEFLIEQSEQGEIIDAEHSFK